MPAGAEPNWPGRLEPATLPIHRGTAAARRLCQPATGGSVAAVGVALRHRSGVGELDGDVDELAIEYLGGPGEDVEGLVSGELVLFNQDALRLPDQIPGQHPGAQVLLVLRAGQRHGGMAGEYQPDVLALGVE